MQARIFITNSENDRKNLDKWIDESLGGHTEVDCAIEAVNQIVVNFKDSKPIGQ